MFRVFRDIGALGAVLGVICVVFPAFDGNAGSIPVPPVKDRPAVSASIAGGQASALPSDLIPPPVRAFRAQVEVGGLVPVPAKRVVSPEQRAQATYASLKGAMQNGQWDEAGEHLKSCAAQVGVYPAMSWYCGLAAWKLGDYKQAAAYFESAAASKGRARHERAAAHYWASRAHSDAGKAKESKMALRQARLVAPSSFYGTMAAFSLKQTNMFNLADYPDLEVNEKRLFHIDPALVHAIIRQESRFNSEARSQMGAAGLMQLMPATALYIARQSGVEFSGAGDLFNPDINLDLGQRYIRYLLDHRAVDGDLVSLLIAYNAGPGNLQSWRARLSGADDALLFVELMPSSQTQEYVKKVLVNYWAYRQKQGRGWSTIAAISSGKPISYASAASDLSFKIVQNRRMQ